MKSFFYIVNDKLGIHALPASRLVQLATQFTSDIYIVNPHGVKGDVKKIFDLLGLQIKFEDKILIVVNGEDEEEACTILERFLNKNL